MKTLRELGVTSPPWQVATDDHIDDNWQVAWCGTSALDNKIYAATTTNIHASDTGGDASADTKLVAALRDYKNTPRPTIAQTYITTMLEQAIKKAGGMQ